MKITSDPDTSLIEFCVWTLAFLLLLMPLYVLMYCLCAAVDYLSK